MSHTETPELTPEFVNSALRTIARMGGTSRTFPHTWEIQRELGIGQKKANKLIAILEEAGEVICKRTKNGHRTRSSCQVTGAYYLGNVPTKRTGTNLSQT